jgi:hypothetical protein
LLELYPNRVICAETPGFVPPQRTISDVTAILDQEKPDEKTLAELTVKADAIPSAATLGAPLALFYYQRATIRGLLGRFREGIEVSQKAVEIGGM